MSFNPLNLQLERKSDRLKHKFIQFKSQKTNIGRGAGNDYLVTSNLCSKQHCEIIFKDGRTFIKDLNSTRGTFVNDLKLEPSKESELFENDLIGLGVPPRDTVRSDNSHFVYKLIAAETFTVDSDDESDIVEIIDIEPSPIQVSSAPNEAETSSLDQSVAIESSEVELVGSSTDCNPVDSPTETAEIEQSPNECSSTTSSPAAKSMKVSVKSVPEKIQNQMQKQIQLRRWNQQGVKLIEAPEMKKSRRRKTFDLLPEINPETAPRKRGRPKKVQESIKDKLRELADSQPVKEPPKPKTNRDLKIKFTKSNRGYFLTTNIADNSADEKGDDEDDE